MSQEDVGIGEPSPTGTSGQERRWEILRNFLNGFGSFLGGLGLLVGHLLVLHRKRASWLLTSIIPLTQERRSSSLTTPHRGTSADLPEKGVVLGRNRVGACARRDACAIQCCQ